MESGQIAANNIYHGDCLELMHGIPDGSVDMILADLPYGTTACHWDSIIPLEPLWAHYKRIIKPRGAIVLTASQPFTSVLVMSNLDMFRYEWVWRKNQATGMMNARFRPLKEHETILVFSPSVTRANQFQDATCNYFPQGTKKTEQREKSKSQTTAINNLRGIKPGYYTREISNFPKSVLEFDFEAGMHPTQKPVALFAYLIRTYTNPGELVLDNTAGSGTTAIAAIETGRDWICMEKDAGYFQIAQKRIAEKLAQLSLPLAVEPARPRVEQGALRFG